MAIKRSMAMKHKHQIDAVQQNTSIESQTLQRNSPKSHVLNVLNAAENGRTVHPNKRSLSARLPFH